MPSAEVYLGLGSNLGDRAAHIERALVELAALPGSRVLAVSSVIETEPVGPIAQGPYLNAVVAMESALPPRELLAALHEVERLHGRDRAADPLDPIVRHHAHE